MVNKTAAANVITCRSYADNIAGSRNAGASVTPKEDIEIATREIDSGWRAHRKVDVPASKVTQRVSANGHIVSPAGEIKECLISKCVVEGGVRATGMGEGPEADRGADTEICIIQ